MRAAFVLWIPERFIAGHDRRPALAEDLDLQRRSRFPATVRMTDSATNLLVR